MLSSQLGAPVVKKLPIFYGPEFSLLLGNVGSQTQLCHWGVI